MIFYEKMIKDYSNFFNTQAGTGFTDEDLIKHNEFFKPHIIEKPRPYYRFGESIRPDHWFDAVQVGS